jgi:hypothetical protein
MKYIFVTGMGRSGTTLLARMLQQLDGITARHEAAGDREFWLLSWYLSSADYGVPYLTRVRRDIEREFRTAYFIDVNSYLQHAVPAIREVFQPERIFHLVRDPRAVIRSMYSRRSESRLNVLPKSRLEIERWLDADKFTRICWNWTNTTRQLLSQQTELLQFERLLSDYEYFRNHLLAPFGFCLPAEQWAVRARIREKPTRPPLYRLIYATAKREPYVSDHLPPYEEWNEAQRTTFAEICGETMRRVGYD